MLKGQAKYIEAIVLELIKKTKIKENCNIKLSIKAYQKLKSKIHLIILLLTTLLIKLLDKNKINHDAKALFKFMKINPNNFVN